MALQHWNEFKEEVFERPFPDVRKVKGWIERGEVKGRVIGKDVFIDTAAFHNDPNASIHDTAMGLLSGQ